MRKFLLTIQENWEDAVWSKVIYGSILASASFVFTNIYSLILAAKGSPYNSLKFDRESRKYFDKILTEDIDPEVFFIFQIVFAKRKED